MNFAVDTTTINNQTVTRVVDESGDPILVDDNGNPVVADSPPTVSLVNRTSCTPFGSV